jgi:hypothetical protein
VVGSYATGLSHYNSNIDLVVKVPNLQSFYLSDNLKRIESSLQVDYFLMITLGLQIHRGGKVNG